MALSRRVFCAILPMLALSACYVDEESSVQDTDRLELGAEISISDKGVEVWGTPNCDDMYGGMTRLTDGDAIIASLGGIDKRLKRFSTQPWEYKTQFDEASADVMILWLQRHDEDYQSDNGALVPMPQQPIASSDRTFSPSSPLPVEWRLQTPTELTKMQLRLTVESCQDPALYAQMRTSLNSATHTIAASTLLEEGLTGADFVRTGAVLPEQFQCTVSINASVLTEPQLVSDVLDCSTVHAIASNEFKVTFSND